MEGERRLGRCEGKRKETKEESKLGGIKEENDGKNDKKGENKAER